MARRCSVLLTALAAVTMTGATAAPAREQRAALTPIQAANRLMAEPWAKLSDQLEGDAEKAIEAIDGEELAGGSGSVGFSYKGIKYDAAKWRFGVKAQNVSASVNLSAAPGITAASPREIAFSAPRSGGWSLGFQAVFKPFAWVKIAGNKVWEDEAHVPFAIAIKDFRIAARAELNSAEPDRPRLVRATIEPFLRLGGSQALPGIIPITLRTTVEQGKVTMRASAITFPIAEFGIANARFYGDLTIVLTPKFDVVEQEWGKFQNTTHLVYATVKLGGTLEAEIKIPNANNPEKSFSFDLLSFNTYLPSSKELNDFILLTRQDTPRTWGEGNARAWVPEPPASVDYRGTATALETGIAEHLPWNAVLSKDCVPTRDARIPPCDRFTWTGEEDSAIWTGHYLAAEAFRYASGDAAALERVSQVLAGVERLFWITGDTAVADGRRVAVERPRGVLARTAIPLPLRGQTIELSDEPLGKRKCYYERPEGGWSVAGRSYATLGEVPKSERDSAQRVGRIWRGWGCAEDHPVSRDQYIGVFYGLGIAYRLVPDTAIRDRIRTLVRDALQFLDDWNVRLAPTDRIVPTSGFLGDFAKQLALLRVGATVVGGVYADRYREVAPASSMVWIPTWFSSIDPVLQYYKFNLSHAALTVALLYEDDPAIRAGYAQAHALMWRSVRHHRNAYFQLLRVLAQPAAQRAAFLQTKTPWLDPSMTVDEEVRSVLSEWIQRYEAVKSSTGMPTGALADPGFHATQLAASEVGTFVGFEGTSRRLATFALPLAARPGSNKDFIWQRDPFDIPYRGSVESCKAIPPTEEDARRCGSRPNRVYPGVDYLLAYWLATYLGITPAPSTESAPGSGGSPPGSGSGPGPGSEPEAPPEGEESVTLRAGPVTATPARPRPGGRFVVRMSVTRVETGELVTEGRVACSARVGKTRSRVLARTLSRGVATCSFRVPSRSHGKLVQGSIAVTVSGATARRSFSARVR
ncbi:MAG: hypothetical protein WD067_09765 [Gaiellaceae bacterium]